MVMGVVVKRVGDRSSPGLTLLVSRAENPAPARGAYPACGVTLLCPCCVVLRCAL
jgi:hypothetical protein